MRTAVGLLFGCLLAAQAQTYKVELEVRDAAASNQPPRHYTMLVDESRKAIFHATQSLPGGVKADTGAKIECAVHQSGDKVELSGTMELTDVMGNVNVSGVSEPVLGQHKVAFRKTVELGKPVMLSTDRKREVEATVTAVPSTEAAPQK